MPMPMLMIYIIHAPKNKSQPSRTRYLRFFQGIMLPRRTVELLKARKIDR